MYVTPYIFHFVHPLVKTAEIMVQRVNFERNLKNIRPATVVYTFCVFKHDPYSQIQELAINVQKS